MWFEVNVRSTEVTDLRWPRGAEQQWANSSIAMSWSNHVQILSFTSMAPRQDAVKHGFVSKISGGCSSYDVIAPWSDLTRSIFLNQKLRKACPIRYPKTRRRVFSLSSKNLRGGGLHQPPLSGWGLTYISHHLCHIVTNAKCPAVPSHFKVYFIMFFFWCIGYF